MREQLSGVFVLDKPEGLSSARALDQVKKLLGTKKAGHAGTLDPFATGLLICCIGQATRLARFFVQGPKCYDAVLRLGITTDSQDPTGAVIARAPVPELTDAQLVGIAAGFQGSQMQTPPVFSALKHQGTPLYKLARSGRPVQKPARAVTIHDLQVTAVRLPDVHLRVTCSPGTYIRTLCADIGRQVGCGGHLTALRRVRSSGFAIEEALTLEGLAALERDRRRLRMIPMAAALRGIPALAVDEDLLAQVAQGRPLSAAWFAGQWSAADGDIVKIVDAAGGLRAVLQREPASGGYNYCCVFN